jgi:hypothetical protein
MRSRSVGRAGFLMTPQSLLYMTAGYTWADGKATAISISPVRSSWASVARSERSVRRPRHGDAARPQLVVARRVRYTMFNDVTTNSDAACTFYDRMEGNLLTAVWRSSTSSTATSRDVAPIK